MTSLAGVLPETQLAFQQLQQALGQQGIGVGVADFGGFRTAADTSRILAYRQQDYTHDLSAGLIPSTTTIDQYRPIAPYGLSWHDFGAAFDLAITARPSSMSVYHAQQIAGALAPQFGLRWGGTFHNPDPAHFELAIPLRDAAARYAAMTGTLVQSVPDLNVGDISEFAPYLTPSAADPLDLSSGPLSSIDGAITPTAALIVAGVLVLAAIVYGVRRAL